MYYKPLSLLIILIFNCTIAAQSQTTFGVLGDIEGNWDRFTGYVSLEDPLYWKGDQIHLKDGREFVFIGDTVDKGNGSIRILNALNKLKEQYPNRVTLILGNRDVNKMRLPYELSPQAMKKPPRHVSWALYHQWLDGAIDSPPTRMKFILKHTMGAPQAFEFRRQEIAIIEKVSIDLISDLTVYKSIMSDVSPTGQMTRYLKSAQIATIIDQTFLTHGKLGEKNIGLIPFSNKPSVNIYDNKSLRLWVNELNNISHDLIDKWSNGIHHQDWMKLVDYQGPILGTRSNPSSLIYGRYSGSNGNPQMLKQSFVNYLTKIGIKRIVVGHTPMGEIPILMKNKEFEILLIDNSNTNIDSIAKIMISPEGVDILVQTDSNGIIRTTPRNQPRLGQLDNNGFRLIGINQQGKYLLFKVHVKTNPEGDRIYTTEYKISTCNHNFIKN